MKSKNDKLKVVFFGTPSFVIPVMDVIKDNFDLAGVVTTPDTLQGRKKVLTPTPVKAAYEEYLNKTGKKGKAITPATLNPTIEKVLAGLEPDLFVVAAYGVIIPKAILAIPKYGSLNIHPSLLPKYRGPSPIQTALLNGDTKSGVTIIKMDEEVDHGPILKVKELDLSRKDTFASLHVTMFQLAAEMLPQIINDFVAGTLEPTPQDHAKAVFCPHILKEDGYFDMQNPPSKDQLDRMIRAYYPWPTAWTKVKIKNKEERILKLFPENKIQIEGGKQMTLKEFSNGYPEVAKILQQLVG